MIHLILNSTSHYILNNSFKCHSWNIFTNSPHKLHREGACNFPGLSVDVLHEQWHLLAFWKEPRMTGFKMFLTAYFTLKTDSSHTGRIFISTTKYQLAQNAACIFWGRQSNQPLTYFSFALCSFWLLHVKSTSLKSTKDTLNNK